ncbi:MAG TPA: MBL fold metallo-hydrolase [Candidatus Saccharibacteria bacterium]|nr:MBL fold metallo-hydrolase [Candidatus Saccharibacteria bacterium]
MELQFFGANCVRISTKKANTVIDDNLASLGLKTVTRPGDIALFTHESILGSKKLKDPKLVIQIPGEYEASAVSIRAISARSHMDEEGQESAVIYKIINSGINVAVVGHIHPDLTEGQLESLGMIDILFVPVGGNGYTLDAIGALKIIKKIEPKIIIPTHYSDKEIKYEVPQADLDEVMKNMTFEIKEKLPKLKLKNTDLPLTPEFIVLERQ